jgi:hypothetical protein
MIINSLAPGRRVWTYYGLREHGHEKVNVGPQTGGMVVSRANEFNTLDNPLYTVKWDTGQESVNYGNDLQCIGQYQTLGEFDQMILAEAVQVKRVVGPQGGLRHSTTYLRNGDTIADYEPPGLLESGIPILTEIVARKPRAVRKDSRHS